MRTFIKSLFIVTLSMMWASCGTYRVYADKSSFGEVHKLSGISVDLPLGGASITSAQTFGNYLVTTCSISDEGDESVYLYSLTQTPIHELKSFVIPDCSPYDGVALFRINLTGFICGVAVVGRSKYFGITENLELKALPELSKQMMSISSRYSRLKPLYFSDILFSFIGQNEDSNEYGLFELQGGAPPLCVTNLSKELNFAISSLGVAAASQRGDVVYGYTFFDQARFIRTKKRKEEVASFNSPGFSVKLLKESKSENPLDRQRKYYAGMVHLGKEAFLSNLEGYIFEDGTPLSSTMLEVFRLNGKPKARYSLDKEGIVVVDEPRSRFLLISQGPNPQLYEYRY